MRSLDLSETQVGSEAAAHLTALTALTSLSLECTPVSDAACAHLGQLSQLRWLSLAHTTITDGALPDLERLSQLTHLDLNCTQVGAAAGGLGVSGCSRDPRRCLRGVEPPSRCLLVGGCCRRTRRRC